MFLKNFLIGAIVSLYILADKEGFVAKAKMATYAVLPAKWATFLVHSMRFTHKTLADLSVARSWILQLSVYCVMWEHPSLERHMRFWSV